MLVIGITGTLGAGKGTVVEYLVKNKDFKHFSVRDYLTKKIKKLGLPINRDSMVSVANDLRKKHGGSYIAEQLFKIASKSKTNCIIESLRTVGEVEALKDKGNFTLLAINANSKIRYQRIIQRASETDKISFEKFVKNEKREMESADPTRQNLKKCIAMADILINNDGTISDLHKKIEIILNQMKDKMVKAEKYVRPSWDEYFIEVMNAIAKRATCDRGRAGTVIVKDKQILVTGYVGSPIGMPHCDDIGHDLRKSIDEDGTISQHCVRTVHSEQNAICQAARRGVSIEGSTVYTRMTPCRICAMLLVNCGVSKIYCERKYHTGKESEQIFKKAGIKITYKYNELQEYTNQKG